MPYHHYNHMSLLLIVLIALAIVFITIFKIFSNPNFLKSKSNENSTVFNSKQINITTLHIDSSQLYVFPENISIFNVRKDKYTNQEVSRGRLNELG